VIEFEDIARLKLSGFNGRDRRMPERNRFAEGVLFVIGLAMAVVGAWLLTIFLLSLA
jgi:hypothetical protein